MSTPRAITFASWNLLEAFREHTFDAWTRYEQMAEVIRSIDTDVIAVQELSGRDQAETATQLWTLAGMCGMVCAIDHSSTAVAQGSHYSQVGLMWRRSPHITAVPGSLRRLPTGQLWNNVIMVSLAVRDTTMSFASYHASPFARDGRADEALQVSALRLADTPTLIGMDANTGSAATRDGTYYDPDTLRAQPWHPRFAEQCQRTPGADGADLHYLDRRTGQTWINAGMHDIAAHSGAPYRPTTGHMPDPFGHRRIDWLLGNQAALKLANAYRVHDTELARTISDHLPISCQVHLPTLASPPAASTLTPSS